MRLYPFKSEHVAVPGARLHYVDEGTGPAVVMVHGNPTWSFYYRELIKAFRGTHRVIAPDHVGCGLSDKPERYPYTLATQIDNLERLMDHVGADDVTLVVHDWGGAIGMGWAVRHPQRVRRIVVFNSAAFFCRATPWRIAVCGWPVIGPLIVRGLNGFLRASFTMAVGRGHRLSPEVRAGYLHPYRTWADRVAILRFVQDIPSRPSVPSYLVLADIEANLHKLADKPMLICWGMQDWCFDGRALAGWVRRFPRAGVHRFADAGHFVVEDASDRIVPLMRTFLAEETGTNRRETVGPVGTERK